jgi:hypothetical protein
VREVPRVTIAAVPRETLSQVRASLGNLVANTAPPHRLVIVDACYPKRTREWLDGFAREHDALLLRSDCALTPNEARNAALAAVDTEFVAFVDDNAFVRPHWLERLLECADDTGAGIVGPLYGFRTRRDGPETVHVFAGRAEVEVEDGRRVLDDRHLHSGEPLDQTVATLTRTPAGTVEFHCMLVRTEIFDAVGPLDEELLCAREHLDLCMLARDAGYDVWYEPAAIAIFELLLPVPWPDRACFVFRWSRQQNERTLSHFAEKWGLDRELTIGRTGRFVDESRRHAYHFVHRAPERVLHKLGPRVTDVIDRAVERGVVAYQLRRRARSRGIHVAHAATWAPQAETGAQWVSSRSVPRRASARTD